MVKRVAVLLLLFLFLHNVSRSFERFMCLDLVLERLQSFLFQIFIPVSCNSFPLLYSCNLFDGMTAVDK